MVAGIVAGMASKSVDTNDGKREALIERIIEASIVCIFLIFLF